MTANRVLIVDDETAVRELVALALRDDGYEVLEAGDGQRALEIAAASSPDLALLDVNMPGMSGFEVLERLKADETTRRIPVITLTALGHEPGFIDKGLSLGADEFLAKPVAMEELSVRVRAVIRTREAERELERLRGDFDYLIAQDLLNYLGAVQGSMEIVLEQESARLGAEARELLEGARAALKDHADLLIDFSDLVVLGGGRFPLQKRPECLRGLVEAALDATAPLAAQARVLAAVEPGAGTLLVEADRTRLEKALVKTLAYGIALSRPGASLLVTVLPVLPQAKGDAMRGVARVTLTLDGATGDLAEIRLALDRFEQARRWQVAAHKGLGLTIAKRIVEAHGGRLWAAAGARSEVKIAVDLPLARESGRASPR